MKLLRALIICLLFTSWLGIVTTRTAYAGAADEKALGRVEATLDELWAYVDDSATASNDVFYPAFAQRTRQAQAAIAIAEKELAATTETREARQAVRRLQEDVQQIQVALTAWRAAAEANDTSAFEEASFLLQSVVEIYNEDVDAYNDAVHGSRAIVQMAIHVAPLLIAFAVSTALLTLAWYRNEHSEGVVAEIKRQLRWQLWFASLFLLAASIAPLYVYLRTTLAFPPWAWLLLTASIVPMLAVAVRYVRLRRLAGRP